VSRRRDVPQRRRRCRSCVAPLVPLLNFLDSVVRTWWRARIRSGGEARDGDAFGHESPLVARTCSPAKLLSFLKFVGTPGCDAAWRCHAYGWHTQGALPATPRGAKLMQVLTNSKRGGLWRLILTSLVLAISVLPLYAQSTLYTDRSGYTTGTQDGRTVNTYTDRYGNTTGWIGGKHISTYSDGYGGTTGTIGNKRISTYGDGYGNTTGTIGRDQVNTYTAPSGVTTGTIGRRRVNCFTDRFRTTRCY
jgi:hypothetical protein